jgi:hypothetical protein
VFDMVSICNLITNICNLLSSNVTVPSVVSKSFEDRNVNMLEFLLMEFLVRFLCFAVH